MYISVMTYPPFFTCSCDCNMRLQTNAWNYHIVLNITLMDHSVFILHSFVILLETRNWKHVSNNLKTLLFMQFSYRLPMQRLVWHSGQWYFVFLRKILPLPSVVFQQKLQERAGPSLAYLLCYKHWFISVSMYLRTMSKLFHSVVGIVAVVLWCGLPHRAKRCWAMTFMPMRSHEPTMSRVVAKSWVSPMSVAYRRIVVGQNR